MAITLFSYWRSSAAYRVRIGLNLKGIAHEIVPVHLTRDGGRHKSEYYHEINPQELVPALQDGQRTIRQSLAILEYLDEAYPDKPLLPPDPRARSRVRGLAQLIACDIHPLNNLRVLKYLKAEMGADEARNQAWMHHWMALGFAAFEELLTDNPSTGLCCEGDDPTIADCCLIPQLYNARRFELDLEPYPRILGIEAHCLSLAAFDSALPENQIDYE